MRAKVCGCIKEATRDKKQFDFGVLLKGVQPEAKAFDKLFKEPFLAWVWIFLRKGGGESNPNLKKPYQLKFEHFSRKGGAWPKSKLFEELLPAWYEAGKKVPRTCPKIQGGGGSRRFSKNPKLRCFLSRVASLMACTLFLTGPRQVRKRVHCFIAELITHTVCECDALLIIPFYVRLMMSQHLSKKIFIVQYKVPIFLFFLFAPSRPTHDKHVARKLF